MPNAMRKMRFCLYACFAVSSASWAQVTQHIYDVSLAELQALIPDCDTMAEVNSYASFCKVAIKQHCNTAIPGMVSGYGPISSGGPNDIKIACLDQVQNFSTTWATVNSYLGGAPGGCSLFDVSSLSCRAAISRFCGAQGTGFDSGFGPVEFTPSNLVVTCMEPGSSNVVVEPLTALSYYDNTCGVTNPQSLACEGAAHKLCRTKGYKTGFGPVEADTLELNVACTQPAKIDPRFSLVHGQGVYPDFGVDNPHFASLGIDVGKPLGFQSFEILMVKEPLGCPSSSWDSDALAKWPYGWYRNSDICDAGVTSLVN